MSEWKTVRLGDVCEIAAGQGAPQGDSNYCNDGTPFVKAGNLIELIEGKHENQIQKVSEEVAKSHKLKKYSAGSILFAKSGMSCMKGYVYQLKNDSYVVSHLAIVKPKEDSSNYIEYCLRHIKPNTLVKDEAYPSISLQDISNIQIPLPPLEEQKHIAAVLDKCSVLIAKHKRMLEKYDTLIKSRFIEMFGDPSKNNKKWEIKKLGDIIRVLGGYAFSSKAFKDSGIPVLRIGNINSGVFRPTNMVFWDDDEKIERYAIYPGDLVMSLTGTVGKDDYGNVCILGNDYPKYYLNQRNAKLEIISDLERFYLSYLLKFPEIKSRLTNISRGIRQANIANKDIENLQIPVPPIELQNDFATFVQQIDKSKFAVQKSLETAETLYKSLMQEYFE